MTNGHLRNSINWVLRNNVVTRMHFIPRMEAELQRRANGGQRLKENP